jgi:hypothetical protein
MAFTYKGVRHQFRWAIRQSLARRHAQFWLWLLIVACVRRFSASKRNRSSEVKREHRLYMRRWRAKKAAVWNLTNRFKST